jgi:hypothetical protein
VKVRVAGRYAGMAAVSAAGDVVAVGCSGEAQVNQRGLVSGDAQVMYVSLDGKGLAESGGVLLLPYGSGKTALASRRDWQDPVMVIGDIAEGKWQTLETLAGKPALTLDEDTKTAVVLICERSEVSKWAGAVGEAMRRPDLVKGY